ncbi:hypothetical protein [Cohnella abietis]|uniref:Alpha-L-rhamnosidase six-hairpin glycosidase domain-containing protein n=1 Tax=Cohnella abietis TaxID=2507935 RepID=A0A3T1D1M1_9BACL|nr:hypothetical protein [Cohnella abietis]BBI31948.1 hypothetical protein KCTCHS21_13470 [Cohnella abietis]
MANNNNAFEVSSSLNNHVDFSYSFGTPHRLTVALPDSSNKTLLDLEADRLKMLWTYEDLTAMPLGSYKTPSDYWHVMLEPSVDNKTFKENKWSRGEGSLPILVNNFQDIKGKMKLEVVGAAEAAITKIEILNTDKEEHTYQLFCGLDGAMSASNPNWVNRNEPSDLILAGWRERADRILVFGVGNYTSETKAASFRLTWQLKPGESAEAYVIRPYKAYRDDFESLRLVNWEQEAEKAKQVWRDLLAEAVQIHVPEASIRACFYASLADVFIMREPVAQGYIAPTPGTEMYRAPNPAEPLLGCIALDQLGMHEQSERGFRMAVAQQEDNGDWTEPKGWIHLIWAASGFKAWTVMEHYRLTRDLAFLAEVYPRMAASSRWQEGMRASTRVLVDGMRTTEYGLMPRGMGDCGLMNDDDHYGVFYSHNFYSLFADRLTAEAAEILQKPQEAAEFRGYYDRALVDLKQSLEAGAIQEDGYRWIPGVAGKTSGSRWGALNVLTPCGLLDVDNELLQGTIRYMEARMSPGGMPIHTGWMEDGMWIAATLDNVAQFHLACGNGDAAISYLYSSLNHGTPLITWCEERGQEPGTTDCAGDRQHLWTPVAVLRLLRDCLVMEDEVGLHLARGTHREWLTSGEAVGITKAPTHFGTISYELRYNAEAQQITTEIQFPMDSTAEWVIVHIRLPAGYRISGMTAAAGIDVTIEATEIRWNKPKGNTTVILEIEKQ